MPWRHASRALAATGLDTEAILLILFTRCRKTIMPNIFDSESATSRMMRSATHATYNIRMI